MESRDRWKRIRERAGAWALSLVAHVVVLTVLAMITWVVIESAEPDRPLMLVGEETVSEDGGGGTAGGPSGGTEADRTKPVPQEPVAQPLPAPAALDVSPEDLLKRETDMDRLVAELNPSRSLAEALSKARSAGGRAVGPGRFAAGGEGFGAMVGRMRRRGLDIVLVLDATDSMTPYIEQAKKRLQQVVSVVTHLVEDSRFGVVAYKDYTDDYGPDAVEVLKITRDYKQVREFIQRIVSGGGGDRPEPIHQALAVVADSKRMGWAGRRVKVVILVGDSPVHRSGRDAAFAYAQHLAKKLGGRINVIDTGGRGRRTIQPDLKRIAVEGGGSAFLLRDRDAFWRHLIVSVFGRQYEQDVNTIIERFVEEE